MMMMKKNLYYFRLSFYSSNEDCCSLQARLLQLSLSQPAKSQITRLQQIQNSRARAALDL